MMRRAARDRDEKLPVSQDALHSSRHTDLECLLADYLIGPEAAAGTANWVPARRSSSALADRQHVREDGPGALDPECEAATRLRRRCA